MRQTSTFFLLFSLLFSLLFLVACSSMEEEESLYYSSLPSKKQFQRQPSVYRSLSALDNQRPLSHIGPDSTRFVTQQMKAIIKNYKKIKNQLKKMELKLKKLSSRAFSPPPSSLVSSKKTARYKETETLPPEAQKSFTEENSGEASLVEGKENLVEGEENLVRENLEEENLIGEDLGGEKSQAKSSVSEWAVEDPLSESLFIEEEERANREEDDMEEEEGEIQFEELPEDLTGEEEKEIKFSEASQEQSQLLTEALQAFEEKSYQQAISKFQKYRDQNPGSPNYPQATYYIGKSFKHLRMPLEAEIFFKEISDLYPQSLWAKKD